VRRPQKVDYKGVSTKSNAVDGKERATGDPSVGGVSAKAAPKLHSGGLARGLLGGLGYLGMKVFFGRKLQCFATNDGDAWGYCNRGRRCGYLLRVSPLGENP
jgi:hypothetical protein